MRHSWADGEGWCLYDPPLAPEPEGLVDFSRRISFEDFRAEEALWQARRARGLRRHHANLRLAYSLPSLDVTHLCPPEAPDFSLTTGRPPSDDAGDSPREGDVLLLSCATERDLLHPRAPAPVDMARQLERGAMDGDPRREPIRDAMGGDELLLSPRPIQRRTPGYVDMARASGRPREVELSAHLWADEDGRLYAYQPSAGLHLRAEGAEELLLNPSPGDQLLRQRPRGGDFSQAPGRPGVDPRVPVPGEKELQDVALLLNWEPRFVPPPLPAPTLDAQGGGSGGQGAAVSGTDEH
jgi:hypothetical protein